MNTRSILTLVGAMALSLLASPWSHAQGMSAEERTSIHTLFNNHQEIRREVRLTSDGYVAVTETANADLAKVLQEHVAQMEKRLKSGRMVRRWDPAFAEFIPHYPDIDHQIEKTPKGLKVTVTGRTPAAVKVAQNHAAVVSDFVKTGWEGHDRRHPAVLVQSEEPTAPPAGRGMGRGRGRGNGMGPPWLRESRPTAPASTQPPCRGAAGGCPAQGEAKGKGGCCEKAGASESPAACCTASKNTETPAQVDTK
jgi:hypothetical protein